MSRELEKMHWFLLAPMGVDQFPKSLATAKVSYLSARDDQEARLSMRDDRTFEREVLACLIGQETI